MKRIAYFLLLLSVLNPACGFGQGRAMFGITGGLDLGMPDKYFSQGGSSPSLSFYPGIVAGIEIGNFNWNTLSWSVRFLYDQKGEIAHFPFATNETVYNYLEIPLLVKIPITKNEWHSYVFVGPVLDIFLNGLTENANDGGTGIGIMGGIGITHPISQRTDLYLEAGYTHYFSEDLASDPYHDIHISVGLLFGLDY